MKIISKINSITSLNDKNLEKFACNIGNFGNSTNTTNNNNNTRFMNAKSFIDFIPSSSNQIDKDLQQQQHKVDGFGILDAQVPLSSAKSLKFNNGDSNSIFWDSFKIGAALSSQPNTSTSNLRNTVSSSNLAIGYTDNQQTQPKFYNFNPQQQQQQHQQQQQQQSVTKSAQDEQLAIMRKNSLPQNTSSCNYNNNLSENDNINLKNNNNKDLKCNDLNVNSLKNSSSKMTSSNELQQQQQKQLQHQQIHQQQQQQQQNSSQNEPIKPSQTKWPIVATPHQVIYISY